MKARRSAVVRALIGVATIGLVFFFVARKDRELPPGASIGEVENVRFVEMLVGGAGPDDALPLIIGLHGRGGSPARFARAFADFPIPARVVLPFGFQRARLGFAWFGPWRTDEAFGATLRGAADQLAPMIKEVASSRATVGKPIVVGFSQGGMLSFALAVLHPEIVRAAVPVAGSMARSLVPGSWPRAVPMPKVFAIHGTADTSVPIDDDRDTTARLKSLGLPIELKEVPNVGHELSPEVVEDIALAVKRALQD